MLRLSQKQIVVLIAMLVVFTVMMLALLAVEGDPHGNPANFIATLVTVIGFPVGVLVTLIVAGSGRRS